MIIIQEGKRILSKYQTKIGKMNISFAKLGEERCEKCVEHEGHPNVKNGENDVICNPVVEYGEVSIQRFVWYAFNIIFILIMLIWLVMSTKRIGGGGGGGSWWSILHSWHAKSGDATTTTRIKNRDIFKTVKRDMKHFVLWADKCGAQNKNWVLYTALCLAVHRGDSP